MSSYIRYTKHWSLVEAYKSGNWFRIVGKATAGYLWSNLPIHPQHLTIRHDLIQYSLIITQVSTLAMYNLGKCQSLRAGPPPGHATADHKSLRCKNTGWKFGRIGMPHIYTVLVIHWFQKRSIQIYVPRKYIVDVC